MTEESGMFGDGAASSASARGEAAWKGISSSMEHAADSLKGASDDMKERARGLPGAAKFDAIARRTSSAVSDSVDYLRSSDLKGIVDDVKDVARRHPGTAMLAMATLGFAVSRLMQRKR